MALLVRLKAVTELRGKGDRLAKAAFRGRGGPLGRKSSPRGWGLLGAGERLGPLGSGSRVARG